MIITGVGRLVWFGTDERNGVTNARAIVSTSRKDRSGNWQRYSVYLNLGASRNPGENGRFNYFKSLKAGRDGDMVFFSGSGYPILTKDKRSGEQVAGFEVTDVTQVYAIRNGSNPKTATAEASPSQEVSDPPIEDIFGTVE